MARQENQSMSTAIYSAKLTLVLDLRLSGLRSNPWTPCHREISARLMVIPLRH